MGHGPHAKGLLEAYGDMVGSTDPVAIRRYLDYLGRDEVKGHWDCPCGSGQRLRNSAADRLRRQELLTPSGDSVCRSG